jgi:predicted DNA-binding transcriptional regulator AlpA
MMSDEPPRLAGVAEVADLAGAHYGREITRRRAWQLTQGKTFPDPIQVLARGPVWLESEVQAFLETPRPVGHRAVKKTAKSA